MKSNCFISKLLICKKVTWLLKRPLPKSYGRILPALSQISKGSQQEWEMLDFTMLLEHWHQLLSLWNCRLTCKISCNLTNTVCFAKNNSKILIRWSVKRNNIENATLSKWFMKFCLKIVWRTSLIWYKLKRCKKALFFVELFRISRVNPDHKM